LNETPDGAVGYLRRLVGGESERGRAIEILSTTHDARALDDVVRRVWAKRREWRSGLIPVTACLEALGFVLGVVAVFGAADAIGRSGSFTSTIVVLCCSIALFAMRWRILVACDKHEARRAAAADRILTAWELPECCGPLAVACLDPKLRATALAKLRDLLPFVAEEHVPSFEQHQLRAMTRLLDITSSDWKDVLDVQVAVHLARVLGLAAYQPAVARLTQLASMDAEWSGRPRSDASLVIAAAQEALGEIGRRLEAAQHRQTLLRAASAADPDVETLLRPASAGEEPQDQLLRPTDGSG
jgi:hypothetical protein